jgi:multidrug efflux pump subunit AcrB
VVVRLPLGLGKLLGQQQAVIERLLAGGGVFLYSNLQTGFLPDVDEGGFVIDYWTPAGTSLPETDRMLKQIEDSMAAVSFAEEGEFEGEPPSTWMTS